MVSMPGGEPLLHPEIDRIVDGSGRAQEVHLPLHERAAARGEARSLHAQSKYLSFSVHLDGLEDEHDASVCRPGTYEKAVRAIEKALARGFRVTTNTTLFHGADPGAHRGLLRRGDATRCRGHDGVARLLVLGRTRTRSTSSPKRGDARVLPPRVPLRAERRKTLALQPVAALPRVPDRRARLRLHAVGHARLWRVRLAEALLPAPGRLRRLASRNCSTRPSGSDSGRRAAIPHCRDCMVHSGFEASAVDEGFSSWRGFAAMARAALLGAARARAEWAGRAAAPPPDRSTRRPPALGSSLDATPESLRAAFATAAT